MKCMKCGREQESEQVFCEDCLLEMEKYPVKPDAPVHLPLRREASPAWKPQSRRRTLTAEEQVRTLKKRLYILGGLALVLAVLVLAMVRPTVNYYVRKYHLRPGQNYSTVTSDAAEAAGPLGWFVE